MLCIKDICQYFSGLVRRFLGITIWASEKSTLCYFNHLGLIKQRKWPFAVEDEFDGKIYNKQACFPAYMITI